MFAQTKRRLSLLVAVMFILAVFAGCGGGSPQPGGSDDDVIVLKLGHINPETGNYQQYALIFKDMVEERSEGRMTIDIYPSAQLGYDRELLESVQFGNLDLAINNSSTVTNFIPDFMTLDYPFLFEDWDHAMAFVDSDVCRNMMQEGKDDNLVGLGMLARGFRSTTNSKKPLVTSADFQGLKLRVIESAIYVKTFEALGANVTAMSWGEVFTALQQGTIEAVELDYRTLYDERVHEVQTYLSGTEHIFAFATMMTSQSVLDSLPEDLREVLETSAWDAAVETSKLQIPIIDEYVQLLQDEGMAYNDADREELRSHMGPVREWFIAEYGDAYLEQIENLA